MNNDGSCGAVTVSVEIDDAGAVLERIGSDPDCSLAAALESAGCDFETSESDGKLFVTIEDCVLPATSSLFRCDFSRADLGRLQDGTFTTCACSPGACDATPPVCVSQTEDPRVCEDCDNERDDDANGLVDCADPNCEAAPNCPDGPPSTTGTTEEPATTTTNTQTTTTNSHDSTTTTVPPEFCTLRFELEGSATIGSLSWTTDYSTAPGSIAGAGALAECSSLVEGALAAFSDDESLRTLTAGLISLDGFSGPKALAECSFAASAVPDEDDILVTVTEASDPLLAPIEPLPDISAIVQCEPVVVTTTSTTLPPVECIAVGFRLASASAAIGALQVSVDYNAVPGDFVGSGAAVDCDNLAPGSIFAPNDLDDSHKLSLGWITLEGMEAPGPLVTCCFSGVSVAADDFVITVDDATDLAGETATVAVEAVVTTAP